jgi:hypothetical protein
MHIAEAIRIALQSLWVNKLRSVLTLLGVVIGVAAVIAVVTFVSGINDYVAQKVFNLGADVFFHLQGLSRCHQRGPLSRRRKAQRFDHGGLPGRSDACRIASTWARSPQRKWTREVRRAIDQRYLGSRHHAFDGSDLRYRSERWPHAQ